MNHDERKDRGRKEDLVADMKLQAREELKREALPFPCIVRLTEFDPETGEHGSVLKLDVSYVMSMRRIVERAYAFSWPPIVVSERQWTVLQRPRDVRDVVETPDEILALVRAQGVCI